MVIILKILLITQNFYPEIGSASNRAKNIYIALKEKGYEVTVLTTEPNYPNRNLYNDEAFWDADIPEADVVRIQLSARRYTSSIFRRLIYYLEMMWKFVFHNFKLRKDYDVVFATLPSIFIGVAGIAAKVRQRAVFIVDIRDLWPESLLGIKKFDNRFALKLAYGLESFLYRKADEIIVNSEEFIPYMVSKKVHREKISFIPNSLTDAELNQRVLREDYRVSDEITVLYAGNIGLAQDLDTLINIAKRLNCNSKIRFEVIGYGFMMKDIQQRIVDLGLGNIKVLKAKSRKEAMVTIANADVVYVSLKDCDVFKTVLPGKVVDYMGAGKAIVANVSGYPAQVIGEADCGLVSEVGDVDELCGFVLRLAEDVDLRWRLGNNGWNYARKRFNWSVNLGILIEILEKKVEVGGEVELGEEVC